MEGEYFVEKVIAHDTFENCMKLAKSTSRPFRPQSVEDRKSVHSYYVFYIKWENYTDADNTWEPEENLLNLDLLDKYKLQQNLEINTGRYKKLRKRYDPVSYEEIPDSGEKHIRTEDRRSAEHTPITVQSVVRDALLKKKSMSSKHLKTMDVSTQEMPKYKIPKKVDEVKELSPDKVDENEPLRALLKVPAKRKEETSNESVFLKKSKIVNTERNPESSFSGKRKSTETVSSSCEEEEECEFKKTKVYSPLPHRSTAIAFELRKSRQWRSSEDLTARFEKMAMTEVYAREIHLLNNLNKSDEPPVEKELIDEIKVMRNEAKDECKKAEQALYELNLKAVENDLLFLMKNENSKSIIRQFVKHYTEDQQENFTYCIEQVPKKSEILKLLIIQSLIRNCKTISMVKTEKSWTKRSQRSKKTLDLRFVETDEDNDFSVEPLCFARCSPKHEKCTWLNTFLTALPPRMKFAISTGKKIGEEDGPFRDDVFLHCLKYGADCQKLQFLQHDVPFIGLLEDEGVCFKVDHMHLAATSGHNIQRMFRFIEYGFDVNAMATKNGEVMTLDVYLLRWMKVVNHFREKRQLKPVDRDYFETLSDVLKKISFTLEEIVFSEVYMFIIRKSAFTFKHSGRESITPPHILHCSPITNKENGGTGENQVRTFLFFPLGVNSIDNEQVKDEGVLEFTDVNRVREKISQDQARIVLVMLRLGIKRFEQKQTEDITFPEFSVIESNDGIRIDRATVLLQGENLKPEECDIGLVEMKELSKPGRFFFGFQERDWETSILVPGMAHIEIAGCFDKAENFLIQLVLLEKDRVN